jgi:hypothetical protein
MPDEQQQREYVEARCVVRRFFGCPFWQKVGKFFIEQPWPIEKIKDRF